MTKPGAQTEAMKRLTDYVNVGGSQLEGERVNLEDVLGEDIKLTDFIFMPSTKYEKKGEFAIIQFEYEGKLCTTSTGGEVVVNALKQMPKNYLPVIIKIVKVKGKRYYSLE